MTSGQEKSKSKILIVEDEIIVAADLTLRLQGLGYEVCGSAASGTQALELIEKESPDLVLMDIILRGEMDGIDAAEIIRSRWGVPVVFVTAYADRDRLKRAQLAYPFGYLLKPFQDRDLQVTIEMALYTAKMEAERKKAEAALRESEARLKSIFLAAPTGIGVVVNRVFTEVNQRLCELIGYTPEELIGRSARMVYPSDEEYEFVGREKYGQIAKLGSGVVETRFRRKDGTLIDVLLSSAPIDPNDLSQGVTFTVLDITEQKRAEKALRESEERVRKELQAILEPDGDAGLLELADIIDHDALQSMMDDFFKFTKLPMSIIDLEGRVLVGIGWQDICTNFHRVHPETCRQCIESDTKLSSGLAEGEFKLYKCKNNMWDLATPIMVGGRHVGNIFMGQFFFDDETVDYELFRAQARKYGFDEKEYMAALERVPRWPRATVDAAMTFFTKFAGMISSLSHSNIRLARALAEKNDLLNDLRAGEEKYRVLVESAREAIFVAQDGRMKFVNPSTEELAGYTREELLCRPFVEFIHHDDREMVLERHIKRQQGVELPSTYSFRVIRRSGEVLWVELKTVQIDWEGKPATLNFLDDITERKSMEDELRRSESLLNATQSLTKVGGWEWDVEKQTMFWTDEVYRIHGFRPGEVAPGSPEHIRRSLECYDPADRPVIEADFRRCAAEGRAYDLEFPLTTVRGERIWIRTAAQAVSAGGRVVKVIGNIMDITERKLAEKALRESERQKELILSSTAEMVAYYDTDLRVIWANRASAESVGSSPEELVGLHCYQIWHQRSEPCSGCPVLKARDEKTPGQAEIQTPDGRYWFLRGYPVFDEKGEVNALVEFGQDITERKRMEDELRETLAELTVIHENAPLAMMLVDRDRRVRKVNGAAALFAGRPAEEMLGLRGGEALRCLHHLEDPQGCGFGPACGGCPVRLAVLETFATGQGRQEIEAWLPFPRGETSEERCLLVSTAYLKVGDQDRVLVCARDITDRKRAEEALRASEARLRRAEFVAKIGNWEFDFNTRAVFASEGARVIYGLGARPWTIEEIQKIPLPEYRSKLDAALKNLIENREPYDVEFKIKRSDTGEIVDIHSVAEYDPARNIVFGIIQDITERKRAEEAIRASENKFRILFDTSPLAIALTEMSTGKLVDVNNLLCELTGYDRSELIGRTTTELDFYSNEDRNRFINELKNSGVVREFKMDFKMRDGSIKNALMFASLIEIDSESYVLTVFQDVTERKRAEEEKERLQAQLLQAQKMESVGTLAGGVAHDFNNLLQVIKGYNHLLLMDRDENDPDYSKLKSIEKASDRAAELVKQLLLFSRRVEAERRAVDLNREVEQAVKILERTIPRMIDIELHPGRDLWPVKADPVQIEQVLLNLGSNSADAMPDGGRLIIETENVTLDEEYARTHLGAVPGRYVLLTVSDTGCGMDQATVRNIFDPFFTTKEVGKGTGLGLASVYGIVKGHGGYIMCYSEPEQGATFKIYLPAMERTEADLAGQIFEARPQGGTETVLIVDDEAPIRDFASQVLRRFGYQVVTASSGEEALKIYAARAEAIDLVILDLNMPGMGGHRCLRELLKVDPQARVLISSGYSINGQVKSTLDAGAAGFIGKPYRLTDLLGKVRSVLDDKK